MDQCLPPEVSERDLRFLVGNSRSQCQSKGLAVSDDEFEAAVSVCLHCALFAPLLR